MTDRPLQALVERVACGDAEAFAELYDEISPLVFGVALRVVRDDAIAQEVAQETLVTVWKKASAYDPSQASVRGWAATLAHRRSVDAVRRESRLRQREERDASRSEPLAESDEVGSTIERQEDIDGVRRLLGVLTDRQREAIELAYFGALTYPQVAERLGVPLGTVKTRIRDGLIKLRHEMEVTS